MEIARYAYLWGGKFFVPKIVTTVNRKFPVGGNIKIKPAADV